MQRDEHTAASQVILGDAIQVMGIVSVLIATVRFASAFTLPGGYRSPADDGPGARRDLRVRPLRRSGLHLLLLASCTLGRLPWTSASACGTSTLLLKLGGRLCPGLLHGAGSSCSHGRHLRLRHCPTISALLHGNWGKLGRSFISTAKTARARFGRRRMVPAAPVVLVFALLLEHFWSYVIIFGLPAIRMWATT